MVCIYFLLINWKGFFIFRGRIHSCIAFTVYIINIGFCVIKILGNSLLEIDTIGRTLWSLTSSFVLFVLTFVHESSSIQKLAGKSWVVCICIAFIGMCACIAYEYSFEIDSWTLLCCLVIDKDLFGKSWDVDACIALPSNVEFVFVVFISLEK